VILVISYPDEEHTDGVVQRLASMGREVQRVDLTDFPARRPIAFDWMPDASRERFIVETERGDIDLANARAVWWRRVTPFAPDSSIQNPKSHAFVVSETAEAVHGALDSLRCPWMNPKQADEAAHHKPYQWSLARRLGIKLPRTLVTTDPKKARDFIDSIGVGKVIYKAFLAIHDSWRETRLVHAEDMPRPEQVRHAPVIFQEYIPGTDLRIIAVGSRLFAAEIDARSTEYPIDMRMVIGDAPMRPISLPLNIEQSLLRLQRSLGLAYGAIDMRYTDTGEYYFLEVNPAGQWRFVETRTGLPISDAVAQCLAGMEDDFET
jgi:glutathione synthase/RimK-type ligase-like ATP-grasp enzyme